MAGEGTRIRERRNLNDLLMRGIAIVGSTHRVTGDTDGHTRTVFEDVELHLHESHRLAAQRPSAHRRPSGSS